ncbi:uracil-DNA glycosylase [Labilibaculum sp. DW002]|uniref:Uracil-DNA glycosylase n=1 Tax=Paralabilibaculum antarcticum TaxID=2912572 RepID=A0ABT5VSY8_9BACT|nr:uracil-DNA glycosylase [Labilibaculum sp. DW002]MDE5418412.1 uracil-DNA glycosylase [Labilibaculum sp. DW002]
MQKSKFLAQINTHPSWNSFLSNEILLLLEKIEESITISTATPAVHLILRFLEMDLNKIPVVILGQDPYPQKGVATGRAFEVNGLNSWHDKYRNVSLKNILRSIYKSVRNEELKYSEILAKLNEGDRLPMDDDFSILPPNQLFKYWWEQENVLLLNTAFTCEIGEPNSHSKIWAPFTHALLKYIAHANKNTIWFLWGKNAQQIVEGINISNKIETAHPMMCFQRDNDILFGHINPFLETANLVNWTGK